jgi:hypothetical protein
MAPPVTQRFTPKKRTLFLTALAESGNVLKAAKRIRCSRTLVYRRRREDAAFAKAWDAALAEAMDTVLEPEAVRRAVEGVLKPVYHHGEEVGQVREYSDTLLIFLLKGGKPARYRERFEHTGAEGAPLMPAPAVAPDGAFFADLATLFQELGPLHGNGHRPPSGDGPYELP